MLIFVYIVVLNKLDWKRKLIVGIIVQIEVLIDIGVEDGLEIVKGFQVVKEDDIIFIVLVDIIFSEDFYKCMENKSRDMWKRYIK